MTQDATQTRTDTRTDSPAHAPTITVNGAPRTIAAGLTLDALVATLTAAHRGVAAAVNEDVVPRGDWPTTILGDGDRVEILTAVQGG